MADLSKDPLGDAVREALRTLHAGQAVPPFETLWAAAAAEEDDTRQLDRMRFPGSRRRVITWTVLGAAIGLSIALITSTRQTAPPGERAVSHAEWQQPPGIPEPRSQPVMWYAPTDLWLSPDDSAFAARPAALTYYDPIHLEVRP